MPWAKKWNTMTEGTWEKVWTHRRNKAPLMGRGEEDGWVAIGNSMLWITQLRGQGDSADVVGS